MAVYFVYRSHYDVPSGKQLSCFDDDNVIDWFQRNWQLGRDHPNAPADLFPFEVYGFSPFSRAHEVSQPPRAAKDYPAWLEEEVYSEGPIVAKLPHLLTIQSDDDELMFAYYVFDDHFAARYPDRVAFLLHDDWRLPDGDADVPFKPKEPVGGTKPQGDGEGATYWACECFEDSCNLLDMGPASVVKGVRIADLARYLMREVPEDAWSGYWQLLRTQLLAEGVTADPLEDRFREVLLDDPDDRATWAAYSDWLQEQGRPPAGLAVLEQGLRSLARLPQDLPNEAWEAVRSGSVREARRKLDAILRMHKRQRPSTHDPAKSCVHVSEHVAQLCWHVARWDRRDVYQQWIFFDDRWAAAQPALANSILRYTRCWDVLTPGGPHDEDED
jgi:uncharacterized protein (TIGR02996 family)